jgi:hypothetical protein
MNIELSDHWLAGDKDIHLVFNFTDKRARINITVDGDHRHPNNTIPGNIAMAEIGQNVVYNDSELVLDGVRRTELLINGKNHTKWKRQTIRLLGDRCIGPCMDAIDTNVPISDT